MNLRVLYIMSWPGVTGANRSFSVMATGGCFLIPAGIVDGGDKSVVDQTYEDGRFDVIDYNSPLEPPLSEEDAQWAKELLAKR